MDGGRAYLSAKCLPIGDPILRSETNCKIPLFYEDGQVLPTLSMIFMTTKMPNIMLFHVIAFLFT
jgi:hypothetical protein